VARALEPDDDVRFALGEVRFGAGEPAPWGPLALEADGGGSPIFVEGALDRVDRSTDGRRLRVVDYKTGRVPGADEHGRTAFQLPLYAEAAVRALGAEDVRAVYLAAKARGVVEEWPGTPEKQRKLAERRAEAAREARRVVLGLHAGLVAPRPADTGLCARCDARDVCRRPAVVPDEARGPSA
jgi:RecB family exonuclease